MKKSQSLRKRYLKERLFKLSALGACLIAFAFISTLFIGIFINGIPGFFKTEVLLEIDFKADHVQFNQTHQRIKHFDYYALLLSGLRKHFPKFDLERENELTQLISPSARKILYLLVKKRPKYIGQTKQLWLSANDEVDAYIKGQLELDVPEENRRLTHSQLECIQELQQQQMIRQRFNRHFFTASDSREPVTAGILGAAIGSFYLMLVTLVISFPLGIAAAIYLEEFSRRDKWFQLVEISISNLAAVPSIVFGILGLAVFINFFDLPRSSALVGGMTLSLMTLPTMILAARSALRQVPYAIRDAARGLGASPIQVVFHHVVPLALPGILTGTIISMARALGETAPLLMIGMMAFIADCPKLPTDAATALPVQIFTWARNPEPGFVSNAAAAILVLLVFLGIMNLGAILLRNRFEHKW